MAGVSDDDAPLLTVRDLRVTFPVRGATVQAVDGVDLDLAPGEVLGLVGESGCGKSTTARVLVGLEQAAGGSARFLGHELVGASGGTWRRVRRDLQLVFQDPYAALDPRLSVGAIISEPLVNHRIGDRHSRRARLAELLDLVGLPADAGDRYPHEFSGGQRQRIGIARALALEPKLLICDEPVSALDVSVQAQIVNLLLRLRRELGLGLLVIAHDLAVVRHIADRVAVMYCGKVVETAPTDHLFANPRHPYTRALLASVPVPDPNVQRERKPLVGDPPSPEHRPPGCAFAPRCPLATEQCRTAPALLAREAMPEQAVACWHAEHQTGKTIDS